jgi:hypothetical protein
LTRRSAAWDPRLSLWRQKVSAGSGGPVTAVMGGGYALASSNNHAPNAHRVVFVVCSTAQKVSSSY